MALPGLSPPATLFCLEDEVPNLKWGQKSSFKLCPTPFIFPLFSILTLSLALPPPSRDPGIL